MMSAVSVHTIKRIPLAELLRVNASIGVNNLPNRRSQELAFSL